MNQEIKPIISIFICLIMKNTNGFYLKKEPIKHDETIITDNLRYIIIDLYFTEGKNFNNYL